MATVVEHDHGTSDSGMGFFLAVILLLVFALLFFVYALPALRGGTGGTTFSLPSSINVQTK